MVRPLRIPLAGGTYHVFARGNARQKIFVDDRDHHTFLDGLVDVLGHFGWRCLAFCLMPNHYHLVIRTPRPDLSRGMRQINGVYAQRFNRRHDRAGHLFQGRFGSTLIQEDEHLLEAIRYVVLNPVRAGLVSRLEYWRWSSHLEMLGSSNRMAVALSDVLALFGTEAEAARQRYLDFIATGARTERLGLGPVVGDEQFLEEHLPRVWSSKNVSAAARRANRPPLRIADDGDLDRAIAVAYRVHGYTLSEIGDAIGCHHTTVGRRLRRIEAGEAAGHEG